MNDATWSTTRSAAGMMDLEGVRDGPAGVVFDCDGTIADTESLSRRAWTEILTAHGYAPTPDDAAAVIGHPFPRNWQYFASRADLGEQATFRARLRERFLELFDRDLQIYPDAVATMRALHELRIPIAVASSSEHRHVDRVLERAGLSDVVRAVVGADDVERHKPHPEPYRAAASSLGVRPDECAAVEDTSVGVASALAAGMFTVAVVRAHGSEDALSGAHRVVRELTLDAVRHPGSATAGIRNGRS